MAAIAPEQIVAFPWPLLLQAPDDNVHLSGREGRRTDGHAFPVLLRPAGLWLAVEDARAGRGVPKAPFPAIHFHADVERTGAEALQDLVRPAQEA